MNSVATTNTSRLRMNAQKLMSSSSTKPVSASRTNYSLQDIIREKQNHIEQLMIERDLDREDAQNQALSLQKTITELKKQVSDLEGQLQHEKRKTEDLQTSVDEATFCGDELNAQTQVYKERITELENQLGRDNVSNTSLIEKTADKKFGDISNKKSQDTIEKEERLRDEVNRLLKHIQDIEKQLLKKDENHENLFLNVKEIQNQNDELTQKLANTEKKLEDANKNALTTNTQLKSDLENKNKDINSLQEKINNFIVEMNELRKKNVNLMQEKICLDSVKNLKEDETTSLLIEVQSKSELLENQGKQLESANIEVHKLRENNDKLMQEINELRSQKEFELNELVLKVQDIEGKLSASTEEYKRNLDEREARITEVEKEIEQHKLFAGKQNESLSTQIGVKESELKNALAKVVSLESTLTTRSNDFEVVRETLQKQVDSLQANINELKNVIREKDSALESLRKKEENLEKITAELQKSEERIKNLEENCDRISSDRHIQIEMLQTEITSLKNALLEKNDALLAQNLASNKTEMELKEKNSEFVSLSANYDTQIKTLSDKIINLENLLTDKQNILENLQQQFAEQNEVINQKSGQIVELESVLGLSQESVITLSAELQDLKTKYEILEKTGDVEKKKCSDLDLKLNDLERRLKASLQKSDELQTRNDSLLNELNNLKNSSNDSNSEVIRLTENIAAKEKTYADLLESTTEVRNQLEKELETTKCSVAFAQSCMETIKGQLKEQIESSQMFENKCKTHEKAKIELENSIKELQSKVKTLETKLESTKSEFERKEQDLINQKEKLIIESQTQISKLQENAISEKDLKSSLDHNSKQIELLQTDLEKKDLELQGTLSQLSAVTLSFENCTAEMKEIRGSLELMSVEFNKMKLERDAESLAKQNYASQVEDLQGQLQHKEEEQVDLVVKSHDLERDMSTLEMERNNLSEKIKELLKANENLNTLENARKELEKDNHQLQDLIKVQNEKIENLSNNVELNRNETAEKILSLQQKDDLIKQYIEEITSLTKTSESTKKLLEEKQICLQEQIDHLEGIVAEKDEKYEALKNKLLQLENNKPKKLSSSEKQAYDSLLKEHSKCKDNVVKFEQNITTLSKKIQVLESGLGGGDYILQASSSDSLTSESNDNLAQINFLNSIIADMQVKNETLKEKVQALEAFSNDFTQYNFDLITKRKPAPRVFCDICDKFDLHETEDCPLQSSDSPPQSMNAQDGKPKEPPPPRKYCEKCEVFGHEDGECEEDETF